MPIKKSPNPLLLFLTFCLLWMAGLWGLAGPLVASGDFPGQWKLDLMIGLALVALAVGVTAVLSSFRARLQAWAGHVPVVLSAAYLLPAAALLAPRWLVNRYLLLESDLVSPEYWRGFLVPPAPWLLIFQVTILLILFPIWFDRFNLPVKISLPKQLPDWIIPSILAGMGLWLLGAFNFSLLLTGLDLPQPALPPLSLQLSILVWGTALLVAPLTQEIFFRRLLIQRWSAKWGPFWAMLASAAVYATVQMRPLLWPTAFITGIGLAYLVQTTGKLRSAVLAHVVFNALTMIFSWTTIL